MHVETSHPGPCDSRGWGLTKNRGGATYRFPSVEAARIAIKAALTTSDSSGQASVMACRSEGKPANDAPIAPDSAPPWQPTPRFPEEFALGSIPAASTFDKRCQTTILDHNPCQ